MLCLANERAYGLRSYLLSKWLVVRIGCVDSFAAAVGPQLVFALPNDVHAIRLFSSPSTALISQLSKQQMDLLIAIGDTSKSDLVDILALWSEHYCVVVPSDHDTRGLNP